MRRAPQSCARRIAAGSLAALLAGLSPAEPSGDEYRSTQPSPATPAERRRLAEQLEAERRREAELEAARAASAAAYAAQREALRAARPPAVRLIETRCGGCHPLELLELEPRGTLGWRFTVERMRWWHGAAASAGEAAVIVRHLAAAHPAAAPRIWAERAIAAAFVLGPVAAAGALWSRRRRRTMARG